MYWREYIFIISYCNNELSTYNSYIRDASRNFVLSSRNFNFRSGIFEMPSRYFCCYHENSTYNHVYTRCLLVTSYCHHEISTFNLVLTRFFLVISCCYYENATYNLVYTRYSLVISYCHPEISTFDLVFTRCLLVISCCYHKIPTFNHVNSRCFLVKTWLNYFYTWSYYASVVCCSYEV